MLHLQHPNTFGECAALFFALLIGHALADYPLQGDFLALHKQRTYRDPTRHLPEGLWIHCLVAHSLIHAGCVWLVTGRVFFGFVELLLHITLDFLKGEKRTGFHTDQALHVASKVLYVIAIRMAWVA